MEAVACVAGGPSEFVSGVMLVLSSSCLAVGSVGVSPPSCLCSGVLLLGLVGSVCTVELPFPVSVVSWVGLVEPADCRAGPVLPGVGALGGRCGRVGITGSLSREISPGPVSVVGSYGGGSSSPVSLMSWDRTGGVGFFFLLFLLPVFFWLGSWDTNPSFLLVAPPCTCVFLNRWDLFRLM